ncbi:hypothetical protein [Sphingomonas sp. AX6]|uniref:hypothetical protein n=1 Tax=Sphingomonas sp. AX6 TaxID=2653171 RepID=UPI0012EFE0FA|nr:hypothetical protein [Sphingomonas sp. AX6]VXC63224.1 conserved hypothetical protein [Sphingomonas sp. AX6]
MNPTAVIPAWVDLGALDASLTHGYGLPVPAGAATALRTAAEAHVAALAPSLPADRYAVLRGLRSATIIKDEDADEAKASISLLNAHLSDVPQDILEAACRAYCNAPGRRFYPRSAGELRAFINPMMSERQARAVRLRRLAERVERDERRQAEIDADPIMPGDVAAICREFKLNASMAQSIAPGGTAG